ncbi:SusC/RagA family TonB-linked outer membrane protein [Pedobacter sp. MC2016-14]|uniref:SusC/RagA family TonB-linked outer membrane protein n=1 Tax=Pedobacter sp. MC2016-14 TaxID=2897327 RepID=UPI001E313DE8|nr:SusC/RagA family TonB-linked outer membrane protein [Pedobacter sp. MC2016-14]MCD0488216.1 SusC/RagA family TonB-linked outer membrane protein [Pedobacter sp. MC2016-14]
MNKKLLLILFLLGLGLAGYGQKQTTLTGQVLDQKDGLPIPGASVFVDNAVIGEKSSVPNVIQNSAIGTVTDSKGNFTLNVPEGTQNVRISYLGYNSILVNVVNKTRINVSLIASSNILGEVIVNGYTSTAKRKNTTATAVLDYTQIRQSGVSGIDQMLEGQVAGVAVTSLSGGPSSAPKIRIRGTVSLNGGQDPLWVLDGIPLEGTNLPNNLMDKENIDQLRNLPIAGLNPDDIADITILKDAAATAIYGARAANGVIVITTKKGKKGPVAINFSANTFIAERPDFSKLNLMNASEKIDFELGLASRSDLTYRENQGAVTRILNSNGELQNYRTNGFSALSSVSQQAINNLRQNNTDWGKELYQSALNQQYTLGLSGGNDQATYYFSGGYYNEKGTTIGTGLERYNMTLKTDYNISNKLKFGASVFASKTKRNGYLTETDGYTNVSRYGRNVNPYQIVRNADGSYKYDEDIFGASNLSGDVLVPFNVIEERNNTRNTLDNKSIKSILSLDYQIYKDLNLHSELGLQFEDTGVEKYGSADSYFGRKYREGTRYYNSTTKKYEYFLPVGGIIQNQLTSFFQYNWKSLLQYKKVIAEKHEIEALAGTEFRRNNNEDIFTKGFGYNERTLTNQNIAFPANSSEVDNANYRTYQKLKLENAYASFYGTLSYTYNRKYTAYGSVRYDGSDLFGVDPKYKYLPIYSVSAAWNANEEDFVKNIKAISNLRLRSSYGIQGNIDKNTSPFIVGAYDNVSILPGQNENAIVVTSPPNNKLRWEKTTTFNAGLDLGLFNNALQITFDYYNRNSKDLIGTQALSLENGFEFTNSNFAQVKNKGLELTISTRNVSNKQFQWFTDLTIAHNKSKVVRENVRDNQYTPSREGYPVNALFVLKTSGLDANGIPQFVKDGQTISLENFYKLYDPYADIFPGELTASALTNKDFRNLFTYAGDRDPKYTGGLTNRFRYANFDLAVTAIFNIDQMKLSAPIYNPTMVDRGMNYSREILNAWTPGNTSATLPQIFGRDTGDGSRWMAYNWLNTGDPVNTYQNLDIFAKKMSYVRINSIRLGYSLPSKIAGKVKANTLRFSVEGRNLFVFGTNYDGYFDPETYGSIYAQPITRSISIGLNATF